MQTTLTKRETDILIQLLELKTSITTQQLAVKFEVSVRTIKYDLDNVKFWLANQGFELHAKRNKGYWLESDEKIRQQIREKLQIFTHSELFVHQPVRLNRLVMTLCLATDYQTAKQLAERMEISKNTVLSDLDKIEPFLKDRKLHLVRKNHYGFRIEGEEKAIRLMIEYLFQKELSDYDIFQITKALLPKNEQTLSELSLPIPKQMMDIYATAISEMSHLLEPQLLDQLNYSEILAIILRVTIATVRQSQGKQLVEEDAIVQQRALKEQDLAFQLIQAMRKHYDLPFSEPEYQYVYTDMRTQKKEVDIKNLVHELIAGVSLKTAISFEQDQQLFHNLFAHLSLRLVKRHQFINEYNPFVADIKAKHEPLFQAIGEVCKQQQAIKELVNDSFVSYITLHFLVSLEQLKVPKRTVKVLYVCSTGVGVTSLIQQKINEAVPNVEFVGFSSILKVRENVQKTDPDLVISIFPLDYLDRPLLKVNPLPTSEDIKLIREEVKAILAQNKKQKARTSTGNPVIPANQSSLKNASKELMIKGYILYEALLELFQTGITEEYRKPFLLHVFLMVHRLYFDEPYENESNLDFTRLLDYQAEMQEIKEIFAEQGLKLNEAEMIALLNYVNREEYCENFRKREEHY